MSNVLSSKAMLSGLNITQWSARKIDKKVTNETNAAHGAAADAGRYNKALIAKEALGAIVAAANAARTTHYALTLPWLDSGARILPAALHTDYANRMREHREAFEAAAAAFVADYESFVADARKRLNGMFQESDYPAASEIARRFTFGVSLYPVPDSADFRVDVSEAQAAAIRADIEARSQEALSAAMRAAWERIAETVGHMVTKLAEYKPGENGERASGVFRDSLVENVRELAAILPGLNITGDSALAAVADRMAALTRHDAEALRVSEALRTETREAAESILQTVSEFM